ncbi:DMT family transporter [Nonomuraea wenchangensis]
MTSPRPWRTWPDPGRATSPGRPSWWTPGPRPDRDGLVAYAVWVGLGALGVALAGILVLGGSASVARLACLLLILIGVVGLRLLEGWRQASLTSGDTGTTKRYRESVWITQRAIGASGSIAAGLPRRGSDDDGDRPGKSGAAAAPCPAARARVPLTGASLLSGISGQYGTGPRPAHA